MRIKVLFFLSVFLIFSCKTETKLQDSLLEHLPPNPSLVIRINNLANFKSELKNNDFLEKVKAFPVNTDLMEKLKGLDHVKSDATLVLGFYEVGKDDLDFVLISSKPTNFLNVEEVSNKTVETITYQNQNITKYTLEENEVFSLAIHGTMAVGSSQMLMENMVRAKANNPVAPPLKKLYETISSDKSATLFLNMRENPYLLSPNGARENEKPLSEWVSLDFSANSDVVSLNGVAMTSDSTKNFINLFKGTAPLAHKTQKFAPLNAQGIISYTFDDYQVFAQNQNTYLDRTKPVDSLFNTIEEIGVIFLNDQKAVLLNSYGTDGLSTFLENNKTASQVYQGSEIIQLQDKDLLTEGFNPLIQDFEANFSTVLQNSFIFSENREALQTIINNYRSSSIFENSEVFSTAKLAMANESNVLLVSNASGINYFSEQNQLPKFLAPVKESDLKDYSFAAQIVSDKDFAHLNLMASKIGKVAKGNSVTPLFTLELETDLAIPPQFVKNHRTNKQEIVVQDQNNVLYLISTEGKVLWTKQLNGRIQPPIQQVDIYKNGRLQLAFCTNNQFMIVDRNGDDVPPFKIDFEGGNLNPLAIFDYEGKKDYRFVITQGRKIFMYNNKAQIVSGFTFSEAPSAIISAPSHFRVANRDYLVFQLEDNTLKILHRVGKERIKVAEKIDFSDNGVFLYKNKISMTNKKGVLHQIGTNGKLTATNFNLGKDHGMYATSKTLVFMDDNILNIKGKKVELDLGVYSKPKIFYIYDKIYVSVTDLQSQKIYLFDSQAKSIPNFPVFGNSLIDLTDMDNDKKLELVAKDQDNSLIVYKMN